MHVFLCVCVIHCPSGCGMLIHIGQQDMLAPCYPTRTLCSQNAGLLVVPRISKSKMGGRAFSYKAALLWNHLSV